MIFLWISTAIHLVTVVGVDEMLHIFFILSRYKWGNKPIMKKLSISMMHVMKHIRDLLIIKGGWGK